jgi:integrase
MGPSGPHSGWQKRPGRPQEGFLSERDAFERLTALIAEHAALEAQEQARIASPSFAQVAESWYRRAERRGRKLGTLKNYRQVIDAYILDIEKTGRGAKPRKAAKPCPFAGKPMIAVSKDDMRSWFGAMKPSPTQAKILRIVRSICAYAVAEDLAAQNVASAVEIPSQDYDGSYDFYSVAEIEKLIAHAADKYDAALYATAALTGLRKGELLALQWRNIDFEGRRVVVRGNLTYDRITTPKNGKIRVVPLVPELAERLRALSSGLEGTSKSDRHVFANPRRSRTSTPWADPAAAMVRYRSAIKRAKLRYLPFHSLRHHFGSQAVQVSTLVQVQAWMGHSDLRTTGRYLHVKNLSSDADLLQTAFGS